MRDGGEGGPAGPPPTQAVAFSCCCIAFWLADPSRRALLLDAAVGHGQCILTTADPAAAQAAAERGARVMAVREGLLAA